MSSVDIATEPATRKSAKDQQTIIANLTKRFKVEIGKSAQTIIEIAAIVNDAQTMIESRKRYLNWLKGDCKMSESQGSKYLGIHRNPFLHDSKYYMQLRPETSVWYLLSRLKTKKLFETGLKYVLDNDPTYADLDVFVSGLLGKPKEKKHTLIRPSKNTVVNREDLAEDISEAVAEAVAEAEEQMKQAKAEAKQAKVEVKKLEAVLSKAKLKRDDEPTPDQIKEAQEFDYDDGENLVRIDLFKAKYKALLRKKELQKKIAEMLHDAGMRHVEAIIRDRQVPAMGRKAAA